ncbi:MAG: hypothetical protein K0R99_4907 [Microbacterium sp.]|jgi:2'-5' RNA ligase|uniref:2'-5' RNA ligase family protein n=1 Tax=Microbacterium sp. TaxID=51671 RepID=UPI002627A7A0|nr:2'-5' RNA ligase family protein [Microbacterium sp.]MDF2563461.1 hypothetical protein [Microbacterium sp.]
MTEPALLDSLNGQQYLVLRPQGEIESFWDVSRDSINRSTHQQVTYPNSGHVTLRGFFEPHRVDELKDALREWAVSQPPIALSVDGVDGFPTPFQIVIARLERTPSLIAAYASLTSQLDSTDFHRIGELPLDEWVFHLSLVYAGSLDETSWQALYDHSRQALQTRPTEVITGADFVWYADGVEHVETLPFATEINGPLPRRSTYRPGGF